MKRTTLAATLLAAAFFLVGCGADKMTEGFKDAERGESNTEPADTITFPDGFSNVATKCDHGNRVYVVFKSDAAYGSVAVVPNDDSCAP